MMTTSPQYDFIKGQLLNFLTVHLHTLYSSILTSVNRDTESPETPLDLFFKKLYTKFDLMRRSKFGRAKFERALHFSIKAKLLSHPLDLVGSR